MKTAQVFAFLGVVCLVGTGTDPVAVAGQGAFPGSSGKPFQALQGQITDLNTFLHQDLAALWTRVGELQAAIAANNARDDTQDALISVLRAGLARLEGRVAATEGAIEVLVAKDALLSALIQALQRKADGLQAQLIAQGDQINLLVLADQTLQQLIDALRARVELLEGHMSSASAEIATLKQQMAQAQSDIAAKQHRVINSCGPGYSIRVIHSDGIVECEPATGGFTSFYVEKRVAVGLSSDAPAWGYSSVTSTCPSGSKRTGGGFEKGTALLEVLVDGPDDGNGWQILVNGTWPVDFIYVVMVVCLVLH